MKNRFPTIRSHRFRDKLFHILWRRPRWNADMIVSGQCDHRETPNARMYIYPSKDPLELLATMIHEAVHAGFSDIEDVAVGEWERDLIRLLRRMKIKVEFDE